MSEVRRVLLANGQYIEIVQETGTSTGSVMSQSAVTTALNGKANATHTHAASNITSGTFGSARIADGAITSGKLATNAVVNAKIADGAVTSSKVSDGAVTSGKLAANAVVNAKIADGAVTSGKLSSNSVITAKILDKAVTKAKLADDVINSLPSTNFEIVTVSATSTNTNSVLGAQVYINGVIHTFNIDGIAKAIIPYGQKYTVVPTSSDYYTTDGIVQTFTAATSQRSVTVTYTVKSGCYIQDKQHALHATWSSGNNENANSIAVVTATRGFTIALRNISTGMKIHSSKTSSGEWFNAFSGRGASTSAAAKSDLDGAYNTQQILTIQTGTSYAAGACNAYIFPDGVTRGYLPACGELSIAYQNLGNINNILNYCGGEQIGTNPMGEPFAFWSSTFLNTETNYVEFWHVNSASTSTTYANANGIVRPFGKL